MNKKITEIFAEREAERDTLHSKYLNDQMVRVLRTIGYDVGFRRGRANISMTGMGLNISIC